MKRRLLAALTALILFSSSAIISFADNENLSDTETKDTQEQTSGPDLTTGTQTKALEEAEDVDADIQDDIDALIPEVIDEIKISNADEFMEMVDSCKLDTWSLNKRIILTDDISLVGKDFKGIPSFGGYFDGQGHTISDYNIDSGLSYVGFFTHIEKSGVVTDLNVSGSVIPDENSTIIGGLCGENLGLINECSFKGVVQGKDYVGGIAGINTLSGDIKFSTSEGFISGTHFVGGMAGKNDGNIVNCRNEAMINITNTDTEITIDSMEKLNSLLNLIKNGLNKTEEEASADVTVSDIGGIAGVSIGIIARSINNGDIGYNHVGYNVGGIAGRQSGYLVSCSNNGNIRGRKDVGGIAGQAEPYITIDFATDIAYQLQQSVEKLHDTVTATLHDTKNHSNAISARLAVIQKFTGQAVEDTRFIANGTVDFANGVVSATNEGFNRLEYAIGEASKDNGAMDNLKNSVGSGKKAASDLKAALKDVNIEKYITSDDEKQQYNNALLILESESSQYASLYADSFDPYLNYYINQDCKGTYDLTFYRSSDGEAYELSGDLDQVKTDIQSDPPSGYATKGTWKHDDASDFPDKENENETADYKAALGNADDRAEEYAKENVENPITHEKGNYTEDMAAARATIAAIYANHLGEMGEATRKDAQKSITDLEAAAGSIETSIQQSKDIASNIAGRDDIHFPEFSAEYKLHTNSLADNLAAMNDNFGLLNSEINNATGDMVDDLQAVNDEFNNILNLYTDALDGVLEKDYTNLFSDDSLNEAANTTDATIDSCFNFGTCEGDIDVSGIAGTMAIEYDYDKESDITGLKDSGINASYLTKCVLRDNRNYGDVVSQKSYAGGVCGRQDMGTILNCGSYSKVEATQGSYVGGVAGSSIGYIMQSYAKGELAGMSYVGGISGDGKNIRECLTIVSIEDDPDWSGAIAGHIAEKGEVRDNYFVSDCLAGIDRVSYSKKAEPVAYKDVADNKVFKVIEEETKEKEQKEEQKAKAVPLSTGSDRSEDVEEVYRSLPSEFSKLNISFVLEDDDLEGGKEKVARLSRNYGDKLTLEDYPGVRQKEGYYSEWDIKGIDKLVCDVTITARYKRYRTTISEPDVSDELHQSELLVDGNFREEDKLIVEKTVNVTDDKVSANLDNFETLKVTVPNDGQSIHQIRFKAINIYAELASVLGGKLGSEPTLYLVDNGVRTELTKTGTMGGYSTYEVPGNEFTLSVSIEGARSVAVIIAVVAAVVVLLLIVLLIVIVNVIKRHGGNVPKIFNGFIIKVSEKIENKEQLFYDDSKEEKVDETEDKTEEKKEDKS